MNRLVINYITTEKRFALIKNDTVEKLYIEQPTVTSSVGHIYLGTVEKVLPGLNAVFVDIGEGKSGFLHRDKLASYVQAEETSAKQSRSISSFVHQGEKLLVQIEKDATGTKGPRLNGVIELQGTHLVYMPEGRYIAVSKKLTDPAIREQKKQLGFEIKTDNEGLIIRTSAAHTPDDCLAAELEEKRNHYREILNKAESMKKSGVIYKEDTFLTKAIAEIQKMDEGTITTDHLELKNKLQKLTSLPVEFYSGKENVFSTYKLEHEIEKTLKRIVWLENGAYLIFDETEALTVIDVNTGKFSGKHSLRDTVIKTNEWAAEEAARQIRLRDLAGMILIDFIDMKEEKDRKYILKKMESALKKDDRQIKLIGFTPLGIMQMTRKKTKVSLSESLEKKCAVCEGTGRVLSAETIAFRLERELWEHRHQTEEAVLVETTNEVKAIFSGEQDLHLGRLEDSIGMKIIFAVKEAEKPYYRINRFGCEQELKQKLH
ncbi:Rne/Rng family ribonuclease [Cytobacillus purgationiresistens]|uniref:Ribonuclease G n=1 Tax=Cytobacillus purgationiresistens TaxID=863449 RepID=A0ABU0AGI7_9BACI|nr:Rne/Rng family ribonuclease [Cytobacillus purgationiresistens]MDQ0269902.1 ribonuclease G [Cytobacillus purgationiresistens]